MCQCSPKAEAKEKYLVRKCKTWRLKEAEIKREYEEKVQDRENRRDRNDEDVKEVWRELKNCLLGVAK